MTTRRELTSTLTPAPLSHFSAGLQVGELIQVAGQGPLDPRTGAVLHAGDVGAQTTATLDRVRDILTSGEADVGDLLMVRVYLTDRAHFSQMNAAYEAFMAEHLGQGAAPARTTLIVGLPLEDMLIEVDGLAVVSNPEPDPQAI